ncbi:hypothetical protein Tsubulata_019549 [Turnera subulata]|uniref:Major facilitator superfamily (MFS) profile domain-containing protein n=1 Tax=Turnera subulata TaxID=218843 RepID=A0A9Q0F0I4_9ROSI|nr:hypothetical protein Tsubulata_019549 [Turnera subulata]
MGAGNVEAGLMLKQKLLVHERSGAINNGDCTGATSSDSAVTFCAVFSTFVAVCGAFCYGSSISYSSPAQSGIMKELGLSAAEYALFGSILTIGGVIGGTFSGRIVADVGLKNAMWLSEVFCSLGWLAIAFAQDAWYLYIGRLSLGFGVGLITYLVPLYIAETAPKNLRGTFSSANLLVTTCGFSFVNFTGNMIPWRWLAAFGCIPLLLQFIGLFFIPESPRWLAKSGKETEFKDAIRQLRGKNADISQEVAEIIESMEAIKQQPKESFSDLLQRRYLHPVIIGVGLLFLQPLGGCSVLSFYANSIFEMANVSSSTGAPIMAMLAIPASLANVYLMDVCGRRPLLMVSASGMSLSCFLIGISFCLQKLQRLPELIPILAYIGILGYGPFFTLGIAGVPWTIMSEIFPVNVKASAGSMATLVNWSASWIVTFAFNFMMEWSYAGTFFIFSAICALTLAFIWKLVPETKGQTLEQIQESFADTPEPEYFLFF